MELTDSQCLMFLHPTDCGRGWNGEDQFVTDVDSWWRTQDVQEFGDKQIELSARGLVYRPVIMEMVPEEITEGINAGKWVLRIEYKSIEITKLSWQDNR